uniref:Uncharacterized protein n=1 Tax=Plectus sambesii TaxID=2011161 RepID=A0A914XM15_9BILA
MASLASVTASLSIAGVVPDSGGAGCDSAFRLRRTSPATLGKPTHERGTKTGVAIHALTDNAFSRKKDGRMTLHARRDFSKERPKRRLSAILRAREPDDEQLEQPEDPKKNKLNRGLRSPNTAIMALAVASIGRLLAVINRLQRD